VVSTRRPLSSRPLTHVTVSRRLALEGKAVFDMRDRLAELGRRARRNAYSCLEMWAPWVLVLWTQGRSLESAIRLYRQYLPRGYAIKDRHRARLG